MIARSANEGAPGLHYTYANVTVMIPAKMREIKVRGMIGEVSLQAEETGIPILSCNVQRGTVRRLRGQRRPGEQG